jgi:hypothetical protein
VTLSSPDSTKHGEVFSKMTVTYKLKGKSKSFVQNWTGDPSFLKIL